MLRIFFNIFSLNDITKLRALPFNVNCYMYLLTIASHFYTMLPPKLSNANSDYCKSGNFRGVEIFAHFAAKWSGAKIKPREYYVKMCVCVCKLVVCEIKNTRYSSF